MNSNNDELNQRTINKLIGYGWYSFDKYKYFNLNGKKFYSENYMCLAAHNALQNGAISQGEYDSLTESIKEHLEVNEYKPSSLAGFLNVHYSRGFTGFLRSIFVSRNKWTRRKIKETYTDWANRPFKKISN